MARSYKQLCGVATALDVIGDRWSPLIVRDLLLGPLRFSELASGLPGIGTNTLSDRLRHLERGEVLQRRLLALPDGGTVYELTELGRELEPILLALGRWGAKSMGSLPADVVSRSRWLASAMLAFHDPRRKLARPMTWELRLGDGPFTVRARGKQLTVTAGAPEHADCILTADDATVHALLARRLTPRRALAEGTLELEGDRNALEALLGLFDFPVLAAA